MPRSLSLRLRISAIATAIWWSTPVLAQTVVVCDLTSLGRDNPYGSGRYTVSLDTTGKTVFLDAPGWQRLFAISPNWQPSGKDEVTAGLISRWSEASILFGRYVKNEGQPAKLVEEYVLDRLKGTLTYTYNLTPTKQYEATGPCERKKQVF